MLVKSLLDAFYKYEFKTMVGVPCSYLKDLINQVTEDKRFKYIAATQEGEALAISAGQYLAKKKSIVICQNSGLGNLINPLSSLCFPYDIPVCLIMSHRGVNKIKDEEHHNLMGITTEKLLSLMHVRILKVIDYENDINKIVKQAYNLMNRNISCCILLEEPIKNDKVASLKPPSSVISNVCSALHLTQKSVIQKVCDFFSKDDIIISTTGMCSRDLYHIKHKPTNFYMFGSMGCASSIALGFSMVSDKNVIILDGDGALLMKLGNLATNGKYAGKNYIHIVLKNNMHASTGGQELSVINFTKIAKACHYKTAQYVSNNLKEKLENIVKKDGPHFLEVEISSEVGKTLPRPDILPKEITNQIRNINQC